MTYRGKLKQLENRMKEVEEELEFTEYLDLTDRERQVLKRVHDGYGTTEIARMLDLKPSQVSQIKSRLKEKTFLDEEA